MKHLFRYFVPQAAVATILLISNEPAQAIFLDGTGHYGVRGFTQQNPGFSTKDGMPQGLDQSFSFEAELRANDRVSFFSDIRLFPDPRRSYLGDTPAPAHCTRYDAGNAEGSGADCYDTHQNTFEPGYAPLRPYAQTAYGQFALEYCLVTAGRRPRDWGLGIFLDAGGDPFETAASVFDGVTCDINIQKSQTLGFSVGYDKLAESGHSIDPTDPGKGTSGIGAALDDLDQYFVTIEFDDRKANAGSPFTRKIGIYFANVVSRKDREAGRPQTDIKFADVFTGFYFYDLAFENEILLRLGKSPDPSWARLGGVAARGDDAFRSNVESMGVAGKLEYTLSRSGSRIGPDEYHRGDAERHSLFLSYAYAPGDRDGFTPDTYDADGKPVRDQSSKVTAMAFHRNYKPALILFNERAELDYLRTDGVFDPSRVMNATVVSLGYRFESTQSGNFELRLTGASMIESMPDKIKEQQKAEEAARQAFNKDAKEKGQAPKDEYVRGVGYGGKTLGYELDFTYSRNVGKNYEWGLAAGYAMGGDAWQIHGKGDGKDDSVKGNFLGLAYTAVRF